MGRRFFYGSEEIRVGVPSELFVAPEMGHWELAAKRATKFTAALRGEMPMWEEACRILARYCAGEEALQARRVVRPRYSAKRAMEELAARCKRAEQFCDVAMRSFVKGGRPSSIGRYLNGVDDGKLGNLRGKINASLAGIAPRARRALSIYMSGFERRFLCLPWSKESFIAMAYLTDTGRRHNDLLAYTASCLLDLSKRAPDSGRGSVGPALELVASMFAAEPQWLRRIVSMFRTRMSDERDPRLFEIGAPEMLRSMIPTAPMFAESDDPNEMESVALYAQLPGYTSILGGLIDPPGGAGTPSNFSRHLFVPDHLLPWLA